MLAAEIETRRLALETVVGSEFFRATLNDRVIAAGWRIRSGEDIRELAIEILDAAKADRTGLSLVCTWDPGNRRVTVKVRRARRTALRTPGGGLRALGA